jgi:nucleoside-diphosphate-sugar epimerase
VTSNSNQKRISCLLTGAEGNLGQAIRRTGAFDVTSVTRDSWPAIRNDVNKHYDLVIHAAGALRTRPGERPTAFVDSNVRALAEILEWLGPMRKPRVFFVSSGAVYGNAISTVENSATAPVSVNGMAKLLSEKLLQAFCEEKSVEFVSFRVFNIFGGIDRFSVMHHLRQAALSDTPFVLNNDGRAHRDFVHVDDVAAVLVQLASIKILPQVLNIGTGVTTRIFDVVDTFLQYVPSLKIERRNCPEAEYSRADTSLLQQFFTPPFVSVLDLMPEFAKNVNATLLASGRSA